MADSKPSETQGADMLRRIAHHEAGHVVATIVLEQQFDYVVIDPDNPVMPKTGDKATHYLENWTDGVPATEMTLPLAENRALHAFAGDAADMHLIGGRPPGETFLHSEDYYLALTGVLWIFPENRERHAFLNRMEDSAREFVQEPLRWRQIQAIAEALLTRHKLSRTEAAEIMARVAEDG
jgi:hypothetical protein